MMMIKNIHFDRISSDFEIILLDRRQVKGVSFLHPVEVSHTYSLLSFQADKPPAHKVESTFHQSRKRINLFFSHFKLLMPRASKNFSVVGLLTFCFLCNFKN